MIISNLGFLNNDESQKILTDINVNNIISTIDSIILRVKCIVKSIFPFQWNTKYASKRERKWKMDHPLTIDNTAFIACMHCATYH